MSANDRKLLAAAIKCGRELESEFARDWSDADPRNEVLPPPMRLKMFEETFRTSLSALASADSPLARKLSELAPKVDAKLGPRHLMGLLVPLERLAGRSARDEEFLFSEKDALNESAIGDSLRKNQPRIVVCENLRSAFNVGAIFRTAETFQANEVWLTGYTSEPQKTAMGTDELVPYKKFDRTEAAIEEARQLGYSVIALENTPGAVSLEEFEWPKKSILILGNERFGVDSQTTKNCDHTVAISMLGKKNSLNVGVAFGIAASRWRTPVDTVGPSHTPIGFVEGGHTVPQAAPRQGAYAPETVARITLAARFDGRPSNFEQALSDLDGFERAWIIFGFNQSEGWLPKVRPPRGDGTKRGLFATRSPHRPNRIGLSCVRVLKVDGRTLTVAEHDFLDGTPIYDIKPYVPDADAFAEARAGWLDEIAEALSISESALAKAQLDWLDGENEKRIRAFVAEQLSHQPLDDGRKRVSDIESTARADGTNSYHFVAAFRTWRLEVALHTGIEILRVFSGYSDAELADPTDPYSDKDLHRRFRIQFG